MKKTLVCMLAGSYLLLATAIAGAQTPVTEDSRSSDSGVPIERLVAILAKKSGKKFVLDPRVHANVVLIGEDPSEIGYPEFLAVLSVYGFGAIEDGKFVQIVPDANMRQYPTAIITSKDTRPAYEYVTEVVSVKYVPAQNLIPILRPMLAQYAHMAALPGTNLIILSERFANLRRIEALIRALDVAEPVKAPKGAPQSGPSDGSTDH